jgi:hypothetical protein
VTVATKNISCTVMTAVRNGETSTPSGYDVGGPGSGSNYNNSIYFTFNAFGLPAGSTIDSAKLNFNMIGFDWDDAVTIKLACAVGAGTPSNQVATQGSVDNTFVAQDALVDVFNATNTARTMLLTGDYYAKMYAANGTNRKTFSSTKPTLVLTYTAPTNVSNPTNVYIGDTPGASGDFVSESAQVLRWNNAYAGTNNPITGYVIIRREWSAATGLWGDWGELTRVYTSAGEGAILVDAPATRSNAYQYGVLTIGTYISQTGYSYSTNFLKRQPYTNCGGVTVINLSASQADAAVTLSWSGASAGWGNSIVGYDIYYADSADGANWGGWAYLGRVNTTATSGSLAVDPHPTRGNYRKYLIYTLGSSGGNSAGVGSGAVRRTPYSPVSLSGTVSLNKTIAEISAILSWPVGTDGYDNPVSGYDVYKSDDNGVTYTLFGHVDGKNTLQMEVQPRVTRGAIRLFGVVAKGTATGIGSGDSSRRNSTNTLKKNSLPNTVVSVITPNKGIVVAGETVRVSFTNPGDPDNNLAGFDVARREKGTLNELEVVASSASPTTTYVDVLTTGWDNGKTWEFFVRGSDSEIAKGAWSTNHAEVIVGAIAHINDGGVIKAVLPKKHYNGGFKFTIPWKNVGGVWKRTK